MVRRLLVVVVVRRRRMGLITHIVGVDRSIKQLFAVPVDRRRVVIVNSGNSGESTTYVSMSVSLLCLSLSLVVVVVVVFVVAVADGWSMRH